MLLNKFVVVCGSVMQGGIVVMGIYLCPFCLNMNVGWDIVCYELGFGIAGSSDEYCFGVMYVEWFGACNFDVFSVVEVCVDYEGVFIFHVCSVCCFWCWDLC